jgi:putative protein-disulfide isomerase
MSSPRFFYVHDPMCSWCWAHRPVWDQLQAALSPVIDVQYLMGGLAPDCQQAMPLQQQETIKGYWQKIQTMFGTEFNFSFWTENAPRRSTYPACRAVIAARWQQAELAMIDAIQNAYYLRAMNPSDVSTHVRLAGELALDVEKFSVDLESDALETAFQRELAYVRSLPVNGFPSMVLVVDGRATAVPLDYRNHETAVIFVKTQLQS